jgi:hypothetical protein
MNYQALFSALSALGFGTAFVLARRGSNR